MDLATHLNNIAAESRAWVAEDPANRWAIHPVVDVAYWNNMGIFTVEQFVRDGLLGEYSDAYKSAFGIRPRNDVSGYTNEQLEKEISKLYSYARASEEAEIEAMRQWEADQTKAAEEAAAEAEWSQWQHHYDRLVGV